LFTGRDSSSKENVNGMSGIKEQLRNYNSSVGIAACYARDGPGLNLGRGERFFSSSYPYRPSLGLTQLSLQWVPKIFPWGKAARAWLCVPSVLCYGVTFTMIIIITAILRQKELNLMVKLINKIIRVFILWPLYVVR
jgi:hypothetical protein